MLRRSIGLCLPVSLLIAGGCASSRIASPAAAPNPELAPQVRDRTGRAAEAATAGETDDVIPDSSQPLRLFSPATQPDRGDGPSGSNTRANQDSSGRDQNETTVALNPANNNWIVGGANDARLGRYTAAYYYSLNGGQSWGDGVAPFQRYSTQADPTVAYCPNGTAVFAYLDYSGSAFTPARFISAKSTDGGVTWQGPGIIADNPTGVPFADRPYIGCAKNGTGTAANRVYASWTNFPNQISGGTIRAMYSDNGGATWTGLKSLSSAGAQGSMPAPGVNGEVYVFWTNGNIQFAKSTNGGVTWTPAATISSTFGLSEPNFRRPTYPAGAVDTSGGPFNGTVYVVWHDARSGDPDILLSKSTNGGTSWSAPIRVNDDPQGNGRDQFFPWVSVDEKGAVIVGFFDRRDDPANVLQHITVAMSHDGGQTFENVRVSDVASNSTLTGFLGDYNAVSAVGGKATTLWCDLRAGTGEEDVWSDSLRTYAYDNVTNVRFTDKTTLDWNDQEPRTGPASVYDVVRGLTVDLPRSDRATRATCAGENVGAPPFVASATPNPDEAFYYLVRAQGPRGNGGFGYGTPRPNPREAFDGNATCGP